MSLNRVSSGIKELDKMIGGGFPEGDIILYSGPPGTGKTIACLHFIVDGLKKGENCIYISSEETRGKILEHAKLLGLDFDGAIKKRKLEIFQVEDIAFQDPLGRRSKLPREPEQRMERLTATIRRWMEKYNGKRLVVDSLMAYAINEPLNQKALLNSEMFRELDSLGMTTILVSELPAGTPAYSQDGITEIMADGIILFGHEIKGGRGYKTLEVVKMRDTKVTDEIRYFDIATGGIRFIKS